MTAPLLDVCCASFAADCLAALAEVRCVRGVRLALAGDRAWLCWEAGDEQVLRRVLPIPGVHLYLLRDNCWFRHGHHLPAFEVPADLDYRPLYEALTPAPVQPLPAPLWQGTPVMLTLVRDDCPRPTTAVACALAAMAAWANKIPEARLAGLRAAHWQGRVLLMGTRLPLSPSGERFWGERVLVPVGSRLEPLLPERVVHRALGFSEEQLVVIRADKVEVLPRSELQPVTRAGLRLACGEARR